MEKGIESPRKPENKIDDLKCGTLEASTLIWAPEIARPNLKKLDVTHDFTTVVLLNEEGLVEVIKIFAPFGESTETWRKPKGAYLYFQDRFLAVRRDGIVVRKPLPLKKEDKIVSFKDSENPTPLMFRQNAHGACLVLTGSVHYMDAKMRHSSVIDKRLPEKLTYKVLKDSHLLLCNKNQFLFLDLHHKEKEKIQYAGSVADEILYGFIDENCITLATASHYYLHTRGDGKKDKYQETHKIPLNHGTIINSVFYYATTRITFNREINAIYAYDHMSGEKLMEFVIPECKQNYDKNAFLQLWLWQHFLVVAFVDEIYFWDFDNRFSDCEIEPFLRVPLSEECQGVIHNEFDSQQQMQAFILLKNKVLIWVFSYKVITSLISKMDSKRKEAYILPSSTKDKKFKLEKVFSKKKGQAPPDATPSIGAKPGQVKKDKGKDKSNEKRDVFEKMKTEKSLSSNSLQEAEVKEDELPPILQIESSTHASSSQFNHSQYSVRIEVDDKEDGCQVTSKVTAILREKGGLSSSSALELEDKIRMPLHFTDRFACDSADNGEIPDSNFWIGFITKTTSASDQVFQDHLASDNAQDTIFCICARIMPDNGVLFLFISPHGNQHIWEVKNLKSVESLESQLINDLEKYLKHNSFLLQRVNSADNITLGKELQNLETTKQQSILNAFKSIGIIYRKKGQHTLPEILANRGERFSALNEFLKFCGVEKREVTLPEGTTTDSDEEGDGSGEKAVRDTGSARRKKRDSKTYQYCSKWQDLSCQWHVAPEMNSDEQRQKIGNAMSIIVFDEADDVIDPSTFNFGKVSNTILFVRKLKSNYQLSLSTNITLSSNIANFDENESARLKQRISRNFENMHVKKDCIPVTRCKTVQVKYAAHAALFNGVLFAFQYHPHLIKMYEQVAVSKYGEIAAQFAPKILKNLNSK